VEHVVKSLVLASAFNGLHVQRLFYHTDDSRVAIRIGADVAGVAVGDVVTDAAKERLCSQLFQRCGQIQGDAFVTAQQKISKTTRRLGADPRQTAKGFNQITYGLGKGFQFTECLLALKCKEKRLGD
jgi:hypothetical protein